MKSKAHLNLGGSRPSNWGAVKGNIDDQVDLIQLLSTKADNDEYIALVQRADELEGELGGKADLVQGTIPESQLPNSLIQLQPQINDLGINKLDKIEYQQHFRGLHDSYAKLIEAIPIGNDGDYAHIKESQNFGRLSAIWSGTPGVWNISGINVGSNTDEVPEGNQNLYFKVERVLVSVINGFNPVNTAIIATDTVVQAISKAQGQIKNIIDNFASNVRSTLLTGLNTSNATKIVAGDTFIQAFGKTQAQLDTIPSPVTWVSIATIGRLAANVVDRDLQFAKINGILWVRGSFTLTGGITANTPFIFITNKNYKIVAFRPNSSTKQLAALQMHTDNFIIRQALYFSDHNVTSDYEAETVSQSIQTGAAGIGVADGVIVIQPMPIGILAI
ncbi:hypothetical protein [Acinetobacter sp. Ac_5812]|uniref:hypothetical protein n=1 Tax=Acinetobacter sp. Ac_5812 TaxID=1848937 RepID=UPI00148F67D4|nr:hypothetical protein [Acinetobacter sp. Ac_5812]NNP70393.1 hypothetical protein [Acinetobacter sp. Ac_5812]